MSVRTGAEFGIGRPAVCVFGGWIPLVARRDDVVMGARRWVILSMGVVVAAGLGVAAWLFGEHGVEFASWLAGVASLVVAAAALVLARPGSSAQPSTSAPGVNVGRDNSGIISTGDGAQNTQHPK